MIVGCFFIIACAFGIGAVIVGLISLIDIIIQHFDAKKG